MKCEGKGVVITSISSAEFDELALTETGPYNAARSRSIA
jgi:hypothetical protein